MSVGSELVIQSPTKPLDVPGCIDLVVGSIGFQSILLASRLEDSDRSPPVDDAGSIVAHSVAAAGAPALWRERSRLLVLFKPSPLVAAATQAIRDRIPEEIRGDCILAEPILTIGPHPTAAGGLGCVGATLAEAWLSLRLAASSTPLQAGRFASLVFELEEVLALRDALQRIVRPVSMACCWYG